MNDKFSAKDTKQADEQQKKWGFSQSPIFQFSIGISFF